MHTVLEAWYTPGAKPDWRGLPGKVANSGAHLLPHPTKCELVAVEQPIGNVSLPPDTSVAPRPDAPTVGLDVGGVLWAGFKDLVALVEPAEIKRLGVDAPDRILLSDYKSTANIARYALTPAELLTDVQANLYAIDVCERYHLDSVPARWVYFETKKVRRAEPRDAVITYANALDIMAPAVTLARELDAIASVADAPKNPLACGDYGGCPHHISAGGPCDARRSLGGLIQARVKKETAMALSPEVQAKFDALKKGGAAAAPATTPAPAPDEGAGAATPAPASKIGGVAKPRTPRAPRQVPAKPTAPASAPAATGTVGAVLALQAELSNAQAIAAEAEAVAEAANADVAAVLDKIRAAVA